MRSLSVLTIIGAIALAACSGSGQGATTDSGTVLRDVDPNLPLEEQISRLPGVYLNEQGELRIRGAVNPPLVVVDGMQTMTADLRSINPADVEQVEVLKGAETSMYGVRGGNGVILITTKTGGS